MFVFVGEGWGGGGGCFYDTEMTLWRWNELFSEGKSFRYHGNSPFLAVAADDDVILFVCFTNEAMAAHVSRYLPRDYRRLTWLNVARA